MLSETKHNSNDDRGIFFIKQDDKTVAELTYDLKGKTMVIDHTEVHEDLEGKGLGTRLVRESVAFARENDRQINPLCPFAEVVFDKHPEWSDLRVD